MVLLSSHGSWQFFFSVKVCESQLNRTHSCDSLEELAQAGYSPFPEGWWELAVKALCVQGMCCGKIFNYCFQLFSSFRTTFFPFLFEIWLHLKKNSYFSSKLNLLAHTSCFLSGVCRPWDDSFLFSFWCESVPFL